MATSIPLDGDVRDRLRTYGIAGESYSQILMRLMDEIDREHFVEATRRRIASLRDDEWVDLEDVT